MTSALRIAVLFPEMLGTYGDAGNAAPLSFRARARGYDCSIVRVPAGTPVPQECDLYLLGGSEDRPQEYVRDQLAAGRSLARAVDRGAAVVAVCSGMQLLGEQFPGHGDRQRPGLDLLPCRTFAPGELLPRAVGHLRTRPVDGLLVPSGRDGSCAADVPDLLGFENHRGRTTLLPTAQPLGHVVHGVGNDAALPEQERVDGVLHGRVVGTYLHGPVLALNPALTDLVLGWVLGWGAGSAPPLDDPEHDQQVENARRRHLAVTPGLRPSGAPRRPRRSIRRLFAAGDANPRRT